VKDREVGVLSQEDQKVPYSYQKRIETVVEFLWEVGERGHLPERLQYYNFL
jgi:predicted alpha/beta hydrolase family esterase